VSCIGSIPTTPHGKKRSPCRPGQATVGGINVTSIAFGNAGYTVHNAVILAPKAFEVNERGYHMTNTSKTVIDVTREDLLEQYLSLPEDQREQKFPTTERAAKLTGMSRRTIQFWVESDAIKAIFVGKNCRIEFDSLMTCLKSRVNGPKRS